MRAVYKRERFYHGQMEIAGQLVHVEDEAEQVDVGAKIDGVEGSFAVGVGCSGGK